MRTYAAVTLGLLLVLNGTVALGSGGQAAGNGAKLARASEEAKANEEERELISLGEFKIVHYCLEPYPHICGNGDGLTASGTPAIPYRTVAVDPAVIPLGSVLVTDGVEYLAEDTGGWIKGNKLDLAVERHQEALQAGVRYAEVYRKGPPQ